MHKKPRSHWRLLVLATFSMCMMSQATEAAYVRLQMRAEQPRSGGVDYGIRNIRVGAFGDEFETISQITLESPSGQKFYTSRPSFFSSALPSTLSFQQLHDLTAGQWLMTAEEASGFSQTWQFSINDFTASDIPPADQMRITSPSDGAEELGPNIRFTWEHGTLEDWAQARGMSTSSGFAASTRSFGGGELEHIERGDLYALRRVILDEDADLAEFEVSYGEPFNLTDTLAGTGPMLVGDESAAEGGLTIRFTTMSQPIRFTAAPEPATAILMLSGAVMLLRRRQREERA